MQVLILPDLYETATPWQAVVDALTQAGLFADVVTYEPPRHADVSSVVDDVQQRLVDKTYIVGSGIGGRIAIQLAARQPHHLAGVMLLSTPAVPAPGVAHFFTKLLRLITTPIRILVPHRLRVKLIELSKQLLPNNPQRKKYKEIASPTLETFLPKIADPLLLLWGKHDNAVTPTVAEVLSELLDEVEIKHDLVYVADGGSKLHVTHAKLVSQTIIHALSED